MKISNLNRYGFPDTAQSDAEREEVMQTLHAADSKEADRMLVVIAAHLMTSKLGYSREIKGRGGWHTPACTNARLKTMMQTCIDMGDYFDAGILAMMMDCRINMYGEKA